jgi:hypothetical protein
LLNYLSLEAILLNYLREEATHNTTVHQVKWQRLAKV